LLLALEFINHGYTAPQRNAGTPYDGETLFRGLFFGSGPVAAKIPTVGKVAPYFPSDYRNLENQIIKNIQGKDPGFFDRFAKEIQSGDRVRIAAAIKSANQVNRDALLEVTKSSKTAFASQVRASRAGAQPSPTSTPEPNKDVAIIVILYVPVFTSAVTAKLPPNLEKGLTFERYVDEIARGVPKN
jgi:SdpC family antimicrobial peptide